MFHSCRGVESLGSVVGERGCVNVKETAASRGGRGGGGGEREVDVYQTGQC